MKCFNKQKEYQFPLFYMFKTALFFLVKLFLKKCLKSSQFNWGAFQLVNASLDPKIQVRAHEFVNRTDSELITRQVGTCETSRSGVIWRGYQHIFKCIET